MVKYNKDINSIDVLVIAFGAMIGWGWVVSTGSWIQKAGVLGTIIGFIIGGVMIYFVGLTYAELSSSIPLNGGAQEFSKRAFGSVTSFFCTWILNLSYLGVVCFEACSFPTILSYIFPNILKGYLYTIAGFDVYLSWILIAGLTTLVITVINIYGVKTAARFQTFFTAIIAFVGIFLGIASIFNGSVLNIQNQLFKGSYLSIIKNIASISVIAPFYLFGFDVIPQASEEINVPRKRLGRLMMLSIVMALVFYSMIVLSVGFAMNLDELVYSINHSGLVTADALAKLVNNEFFAKLLIFGGLCGIVTSWNSFLIGGSRSIASLAKSMFIPSIFGKLHQDYKTPYISIILLGMLSFISVFFGKVMLTWISNAASFACCIAYCIVAASYLRLRKKEPELNRPYRVKHYKFVGYMASGLSFLMAIMYILPNTGCTFNIQEWIIVILWSLLGIFLLLYNFYKKGDKKNEY